MELSLICPIKHIERTSLLPGRFCIAPVAIRYDEYKRYFINASGKGYKVILDNGIFEEDQVQDEDYINLARQIKPRVLVAPDTINAGAKENLEAANKFAEMVQVEELNASLQQPIELMHVLQCRKDDDSGFWVALRDVLDEDTYQWIGICRDVVFNAFSQYTHTEDQELNRFYFAARLQERFPTIDILRKKWHFLGMGKRLDLLQYFWFVDAMDTASLFYQSTLINYVDTDSFTLLGDLKRPKDYFTRDFSPEEDWIDTLKFNCNQALYCAQRADINRRKQLGGRL